jgi:hypothetical protein
MVIRSEFVLRPSQGWSTAPCMDAGDPGSNWPRCTLTEFPGTAMFGVSRLTGNAITVTGWEVDRWTVYFSRYVRITWFFSGYAGIFSRIVSRNGLSRQ